MQSSNPVLGRLRDAAGQQRNANFGVGTAPGGANQWAPYPQAPYQQQAPHQVDQPSSRMMTIDDVVTRTVLLILTTGVFGAGGWLLLPDGPLVTMAVVGSSIAGLVLGLVISFRQITNPALIFGYAALQGVWLGVVSRMFENLYAGIVLQAVIGTFGVFLGMGMLYKFRVLRATPRFARGVLGALIGVVALSLINWLLYMFGLNMGLVDYNVGGSSGPGLVPILFSLACIVIGALTFILDFDAVEQGVRHGLPERYAWYCAFGLLVGLVYLYWQILRLLEYLRR